MAEFILKSGAKVVATPAAYADAGALRRRIMQKMGELNISRLSSASPSYFMVFADDEIERLLFACAKTATYEGAKVEPKLLDDIKLGEQARGDLFEIFDALLEVNFASFFPKASTASSPAPASAA